MLLDALAGGAMSEWVNHPPLSKLRGPLPIGFVVVLLGLFSLGGQAPTRATDSGSSYRVLWDDHGTFILIAVSPQITDEKLRAVLKEVADNHQDDPARDYLVSDHLWVLAYLEEDGRCSKVDAGRLRRFVPPRNVPASGQRTKRDRVIIRIRAAQRSLQEGTLTGRGCSGRVAHPSRP